MATDENHGIDDLWEPFRFFLGSWAGSGTGKPGVSSVERTCALILANRFIEIKSRSVYQPQEKNPSGEIHEELGLISYDQARSRYVLREFHVEGFVNQYGLETPAPGNKQLTFVTEAIENIPAGWRARTTLEILSPDSFRETFELAGPGKQWACYITTELQRAP